MSARILLIALMLVACTRTPGPGIDVDRALMIPRALSEPRPHDGPGAAAARALIEHELAAMGVAFEEVPTGTIDLPSIEVMGVTYRTRRAVTIGDANVVARFGAPGKALLFMAHYDSVPGAPGAADNAAAVGVLVELARVLHDEPPAQPVIIAFTAAEEVGLVGAEALAAQLGDEVGFAIALDLIGGDGPLVINGASTLIGKSELAWLAHAADQAGVDLSAPLVHRIVSRWWPQAERSDHGPFTRQGIRAVHFYNRGSDGEWIDLAYHSERDRWSRVHPASIAAVGRLVRALAMSPIPPHDGDGFYVPIAHVVVPRWGLLAFEVLLLGAAVIGLWRRRHPLTPGVGLLAGAACYALAVGVAIAIEKLAWPYAGAWLLSPLRGTIASLLVLAGAFGLATRVIARFRPWAGVDRYRAFASLFCALVGVGLLAAGAAEIAWLWIVPAALIAFAPWPIAIVSTALPAMLVLDPRFLREGAWNMFLPPSLPVTAVVAAVTLPFLVTVAWALRRHAPRTGPLGTLVLSMGCGLAVSLGFLMAISAHPTCSAAEFWRFSLACDRV